MIGDTVSILVFALMKTYPSVGAASLNCNSFFLPRLPQLDRSAVCIGLRNASLGRMLLLFAVL
jgi:hypothetical protein